MWERSFKTFQSGGKIKGVETDWEEDDGYRRQNGSAIFK